MTEARVLLAMENGVARLTIANPPLNILTPPIRAQLLQHLKALSTLGTIRVVVLIGDGDRAFCAGADLAEEGELTGERVAKFVGEDKATYEAVEASPVPVIAAINGHCMGGGLELALACDIRIALEEAAFCAPGVKFGLVANTARLTRTVGVSVAKDLALTGRVINGREAERVGLVSRAVSKERFDDEINDWATTVAQRAPLAVQLTKEAVNRAADVTFSAGLAIESEYFTRLLESEDHKEAVSAFFRRQEPTFRGR